MTYQTTSHSKQKEIEKLAKAPDAFVSSVERGWEAIEQYKTLLFAAIGVLILVGAGYTAYGWNKNRVENKARVEIFNAQKNLEVALKDFEVPQEELAKQMAAGKGKDKLPPPKAKREKSGNIDTDIGPQVTAIEQIIAKHKGTQAAALATLELAPILTEYKQTTKLKTLLQAASEGLKSKDFLYGFVQLQYGNTLVAENPETGCNEAVQVWQTVVNSKVHTFLHGDALLKQGLCYEKLGQKAQAIEQYKKIAQDFGDTEAGKSAKIYLRLLENENT